MLSLVVGVVTAVILLAVGLELWLIFGAPSWPLVPPLTPTPSP